MPARKVEVKCRDTWVEVPMSAVRKGETFRMFELDGRPVEGVDGTTEWVAANDAKLMGIDGTQVWTVEVSALKDTETPA